MKVSRLEIQKAKEYRDQILGRQSSFSPTVEENIKRLTSNALLFDIETGGLDSKSSIYEMGFMRGIGSDAQFSHHLVRPNRNAPPTSEFTNQRFNERNRALEASTGRPDAFTRAIRSDGITQREAALTAYDHFKGKDIWVQNLKFEREALNERVRGRAFNDIAKGIGLESFSGGGGVHVTPIGLKKRLAEAGRQYNVGNIDSYLNSWEDVFTKGFVPELSKPKRNMTRAFEVMDLTKSVFAMAQKRGYMKKTGDLFTGTSIDAFAKSMFGLDELHAANADNVLQGRVIHNMLGAGLLMQEGKELPEHMQKFFTNLDAALPEQRHRNAVKNIIRTFRDQQEFKASQAEGAPKWSLLEGSRLDREPDSFDLFVDTTDDGKNYRREKIRQPKRASLTPGPDTQFRYTTDIDKLAGSWQSQQRFGQTVNYQAALEEARASYINHYQAALGGSSTPDSIRKALADTESIAVKAREALEVASWKSSVPTPAAIEAKPANLMEQGKSFIKSNWKIGLAGAGLIVAANLISGDDDNYNYIEGMRHAGISGSSRKQNTDFGSGWNALRGLVRAEETFAEMIGSKGFKEALESSRHSRDLGAGQFGKTAVRSATFRGHEFDFVRKVLNTESTAKTLHTVDFHREAGLAKLVSESVGPDIYGVSSGHLDMELFAGTPLRHTPLDQLDKIKRPLFDDAINKLHEKGIYHSDLNPGNIMYIPEEGGVGRIGIIDFGHHLTKQNLGPDTVFTGVKKEMIPGGGVKNTPVPISWEEAKKADFQKAYGGYQHAKTSSEARYSGSVGPTVRRVTTPANSSDDVWIGVQPAPIPGRPVSNTSGNTIKGFPESPIASSRRGQNTGGQFESPWRGLLKLTGEEEFGVLGLMIGEVGGLVLDQPAGVVAKTLREKDLSPIFASGLQKAADKGIQHPITLIESTIQDKKEMAQVIRGIPEDEFGQGMQKMKEQYGFSLTKDEIVRAHQNYDRGVIKHERFHQKMRSRFGSNYAQGDLPEEVVEIFKNPTSGYSDRPETWFEEYHAHREQYRHYPETLLHSHPDLFIHLRKEEAAGRMGITPARRRRIVEQRRALDRKDKIGNRPLSNTQHNTIEGFPEQGVAGANRKTNTGGQFGSPWQGLGNLAMAGIFTANAIAGSMPSLPSTATRTADVISQRLVQGMERVTSTIAGQKAGSDFLAITPGDPTLIPQFEELGLQRVQANTWPSVIEQAKRSGKKNIILGTHGLNGTGFALPTGGANGQVDIASASWIGDQLPASEGYKVYIEACNANSVLATNAGYDPTKLAKVKENAKKLHHDVLAIRDSNVKATNIFTRSKLGLSKGLQPGIEFPRPSAVLGSEMFQSFYLEVLSGQGMTNTPGVFGRASDSFGFGEWIKQIHSDITDTGTISEKYLSDLETSYSKLLSKGNETKSVSHLVSTGTLHTSIIPGSEIPSNVSVQSSPGFDIVGPNSRELKARRIRRKAKVRTRPARSPKQTPIQQSVAQVQPDAFTQQLDKMEALRPGPTKGYSPVKVATPTLPGLRVPADASIPRGTIAQQPSNAVSHVAPQVAAHTEAPAVKIAELTRPIEQVQRAEGVVSHSTSGVSAAKTNFENGLGAFHGKTPEQILGAIQTESPGPIFTKTAEPETIVQRMAQLETRSTDEARAARRARAAEIRNMSYEEAMNTPEAIQAQAEVREARAKATNPNPSPHVHEPFSPSDRLHARQQERAAEAPVKVRTPTTETHPNRQTSNIVSAVADQVAEKTVAPAVETAVKTKAVNPIARAKGAVSGNKGLIAAAAIGLGGLFWAMSGSSKKDGNNQFGSPWAGLRYIADDLVAIPSEQYAMYNAREERKRKKEQEGGGFEAVNPYFGGDSLATVGVDDYSVEDADTIKLFMGNGQTTSMRLAGIDAPEIEHEGQDGKIWANQPYGQEAKTKLQELLAKQSNIQAVIDPKAAETYGRPVGMLIGDNGQNLNLELVKSGAAASLPYGKRSDQIFDSTQFKRAERDAVAAQTGMWSTEEWNIAREAQLNNKRRITNVSYTDLGRLFKDFKTSSVLNRMRNPDAEFSDMQASGGRDDFNVIEGMKHGWIGANRTLNTDFGSPYKINTKTIPRVPRSYRAKRRVIEGQYAANTQLRRSMKRESYMNHHKG